MQRQMSRYFSEKLPGSVASSGSDDLNRVLILTLAFSMQMTRLVILWRKSICLKHQSKKNTVTGHRCQMATTMNHIMWPRARSLFLCLLFNMIWETETVNTVAYIILEDFSARAFSAPTVSSMNSPMHLQLSLPIAPSIVAGNVVGAVVKGYSLTPQKEIQNYINAVGIILAALPKKYWNANEHHGEPLICVFSWCCLQ
ncbi:mediator of RNA polymerase II transcription subunit 23-like isoform X2 [Rhagoletis pomonella]|uniref:mediator of RNA polymerase II transcription subunit 23-like isoform X2 n=1 Tax=Rhagoletis pomonella TaxID=28610 RepID=UPI00177DDD1A|nr:mediator of RNA polymerase II transcription subunit 23-like isoform X2 [Rhagoletis pomonella]